MSPLSKYVIFDCLTQDYLIDYLGPSKTQWGEFDELKPQAMWDNLKAASLVCFHINKHFELTGEEPTLVVHELSLNYSDTGEP